MLERRAVAREAARFVGVLGGVVSAANVVTLRPADRAELFPVPSVARTVKVYVVFAARPELVNEVGVLLVVPT